MAKVTQQSVLFPALFAKTLKFAFDAESLTSDGGAPLLGALDRGLGLTQELVGALSDWRDPAKTKHSLKDLFRQRVTCICLGYVDGNDAGRVGKDPGLKVALGRGPDSNHDLASSPTLCRFENGVTARELAVMGRRFEAWRLKTLKKRFRKPKVITLDLDSMADSTHGQQQFTFFNAHYDTYCYQPVFGYVSFDDDAEQYLLYARLRPGNSADARAVIPFLRRTVKRLRKLYPKAQIRIRADSGFGKSPRLLDFLDELGVKYVVAYQENSRLKTLAQPWADEAMEWHEEGYVGEDTQVFGELHYKTRKTWPYERRVIVKAEVTATEGREPRINRRFVISNMNRFKPRGVYRFYCARGDSENRIKELECDLQIDRTSCSRFLANAFRVLLTLVAYALFQELRWRLRRTRLARAQVCTLRLVLLKVAARVEETVRRIVFHLPTSYPWVDDFRRAAKAAGAVPG